MRYYLTEDATGSAGFYAAAGQLVDVAKPIEEHLNTVIARAVDKVEGVEKLGLPFPVRVDKLSETPPATPDPPAPPKAPLLPLFDPTTPKPKNNGPAQTSLF